MKKLHLQLLVIFLSILLLILSGFIWRDSLAQTSSARYFPQTGHWVSGEFLEMYESIENPEEIFGFPISVMFEEKISHRVVQYFERTRFELHPQEPVDLLVQRSELGKFLYKTGRPLPGSMKLTRCQDFLDIEHTYQVCGAFLDFFNKNGKVPIFGYPVSNAEIHGDRIVQYFQLARLEWHPDKPPEQRVKVSDLGLLYFNRMKEDPRLRLPPDQNSTIQTISGIQARAFSGSAVVESKGDQAIYVIVLDQNHLPVENVKVEFEVLLPTGEVLSHSMPFLTDEKGVAIFTFTYRSSVKGEAIATVRARFSNFEDITSTSFRVWW